MKTKVSRRSHTMACQALSGNWCSCGAVEVENSSLREENEAIKKSHAELLAIAKYYHQTDDISFKIHQKSIPDCSDCKAIAKAEKLDSDLTNGK